MAVTSLIVTGFLWFAEVKRETKRAVQNRNELAAVSFELDKEKHVLRQMQGVYRFMLLFCYSHPTIFLW